MSTSKNRPLWIQLPVRVRGQIERLLGGRVVRARNCWGGFSPGFASRLVLADGGRFFVKAMDADAWPWEAELYRSEAGVAVALPATVPAPRLLGTFDDGHWVVLRVVASVVEVQAVTPSPVGLPRAAGSPSPTPTRVCSSTRRSTTAPSGRYPN